RKSFNKRKTDWPLDHGNLHEDPPPGLSPALTGPLGVAGGRTARHHRVGDQFLHHLAGLVVSSGAYFEEAAIGPRVRQPLLDHFALNAQFVTGNDRNWPAQIIHAEPDGSLDGPVLASGN